MSTIADQPAFPTDVVSRDPGGIAMDISPKTFSGMTLRQYCATKCMQGLLASWGDHDVTDYGELAHDAVLAADKLIAELSKPTV